MASGNNYEEKAYTSCAYVVYSTPDLLFLLSISASTCKRNALDYFIGVLIIVAAFKTQSQRRKAKTKTGTIMTSFYHSTYCLMHIEYQTLYRFVMTGIWKLELRDGQKGIKDPYEKWINAKDVPWGAQDGPAAVFISRPCVRVLNESLL
jgi:uncharacterized membrane protein YiaA